jgi:antitoxin ParD1/3/4
MRSNTHLALPASLKLWAEKQATENGYGSVSQYVGEILRREQQRSRIDSHLLAAVESGESTPMTPRHWRKIRAHGIKLARAQRKK